MNSLQYRTVIFDLDGTLIDSAPSILASFERALERAGMIPSIPLDESLIGPPLHQTLINLTGCSDEAVLDTLVSYFKESYDTEGYKATRVYDGIPELLSTLVSKGIALAIATNKRRIPTLRILEHLGWERYFKLVGTLDTPSPPHAGKGVMLGSLLRELSVSAADSIYLGDKQEDGKAADANQMPFIAAGWGYGVWDALNLPEKWQVLSKPADLFNHHLSQAR